MKENYTALYPNDQVAKAVGDYAYEHSTPLPAYLTAYHTAMSRHERADYMISPLQAQFMWFTAKIVGAKRILEIGVFVGFSTMAWAEAVGPDGHVTGLEFSEEYAELAHSAFRKHNISNVTLHIGDAKSTLETLAQADEEPYDLVFVDADKVSYPRYLELLLENSKPGASKRLLKPGAVIIADNVLRRGLIADSTEANPWAAKMDQKGGMWRGGDMDALKRFNKDLVNNERLETFLMPMFDGLGMARLKD